MKHIVIVPKNKAVSLIPKIISTDSLCYYLVDDYSYFTDLRDKLVDIIEIKNLSGLFDDVLQEIKPAAIDLLSKLNRRYDSFEWWGNHIASHSSSATPLLLNITYLFCAKKILSDSPKDVIFIIQSPALGDCILKAAAGCGYNAIDYGKTNIRLEKLKRRLRYFAQAIYFFKVILQERAAAFKFFNVLPAKKPSTNKRVVVRSWITMGNFDKSGKFCDRNFGRLPDWLRSKDYEVWTLPMFFNISLTPKKLYALLRKQNQPFLFPGHYLKFSDYWEILRGAYRLFRLPIENAQITNIDVSPIFNEVLLRGFYPHLLFLNLSSSMLRRLKEKGFEIDGFYYPFESNAPEKQFILSCRKYFPDSEIIGYQHTTFLPNHMAYYLGPDEKNCHPLPDKIICSGPIYMDLYKQAGYPAAILVEGYNLRYNSVYPDKQNPGDFSRSKKILLLPLTFSYNFAFELFEKVNQALKDNNDYKICIRTHPLLSKDNLVKFLDRIGMKNYEFADVGIIQDWFSRSFAVISTGGSATTVEAVSFGVPVIRVIPDNTFHLDSLTWPDYPLAPVNSAGDIRKQLALIEKLNNDGENIFSKIGREVLTQYFTKPMDDNLDIFLLRKREEVFL